MDISKGREQDTGALNTRFRRRANGSWRHDLRVFWPHDMFSRAGTWWRKGLIGGEHTVEAGQIEARFRDQGREADDRP